MSETNLSIISLEAENIKRLRAITIKPDGNTVIIGGNNGQGKTSTLDSIAMALGGGKLIPEKPIRKGQKSARIAVDLGDLKVERRFTSKGSILEVKSNGLIQTSPQSILDKLTGNLSFDPLAFVNMKPADQLKTLKELVGVNFDDLEVKRQELYAERTLVNRDAKNLEGQLEGIPEHENAPEAVSIEALLSGLEQAESHNRAADQVALREEEIGALIAAREEELDQLRQRAVQVKDEIKILSAERNGLKIPKPIDTAPIRVKLQSAEEINRQASEVEARQKVSKQVKAKHQESTRLTLAIEKVDEEKAERLAKAQFPIEGLSFSEEGVLLDGFPFEQASSAEQLKVSVAMGIAMNPKLKVLLIRDGSLLDEASLKAVAEMAELHNAQVWIERVGKGAECSVVIEDGMIEGENNDTERESF